MAERNASPLVERMVGLLHEEFESIADGLPIQPELKLAEKYGVGRRTVRAAMAVLEKDGLIRRVRGKGTFPARGSKARPLFRSRAKRLGLVSWVGLLQEGDCKGFYDLILQGMLEMTLRKGGELVISGGGPADRKAEACLRLAEDPQVDGIALVSATDQDLLATIAAKGKAVCLVDHYSSKAAMDCVRVDSFGGACLTIEHLHNLGHRRIAYMQPDRADLNPSRLKGYEAALGRLGIPFRPEFVVSAPTHAKGAAEAVTRLLALEAATRPTAIMAFSNEMALGAIEGISRFGLRVPDDLSVMGAGGDAPVTMPDLRELTTTCCDPARMGHIAVEYLFDRLGSPEIEPRNTVVPVQLRFGSSTAPPPKHENERDKGAAYAGRSSKRTRPAV